MFIDQSGRLVNYSQLRTSSIYNDICEMAKYLTTINLDNVTENERKTFFISNYYNYRRKSNLFLFFSLLSKMFIMY
jgi:hypothetical protein